MQMEEQCFRFRRFSSPAIYVAVQQNIWFVRFLDEDLLVPRSLLVSRCCCSQRSAENTWLNRVVVSFLISSHYPPPHPPRGHRILIPCASCCTSRGAYGDEYAAMTTKPKVCYEMLTSCFGETYGCLQLWNTTWRKRAQKKVRSCPWTAKAVRIPVPRRGGGEDWWQWLRDRDEGEKPLCALFLTW